MSRVLTQQNVIMNPTGGGGSGVGGGGGGGGGNGIKVNTLNNSQANEKNKQITRDTATASVSTAITTTTNTLSISDSTNEYDDFNSTSSIMEFLKIEQKCSLEPDAETIFEEVSRLANNNDNRSVDEILEEAQRLMQQQHQLLMGNDAHPADGPKPAKQEQAVHKSNAAQNGPQQNIKMNEKYTRSIENVGVIKNRTATSTPQTPMTPSCYNMANSLLSPTDENACYNGFYDNLPSESILSQESAPKEIHNSTLTTFRSDACGLEDDEDRTTVHINGYDSEEGTDTLEEMTDALEIMQLDINHTQTTMQSNGHSKTMSTSFTNYNNNLNSKTTTASTTKTAPAISTRPRATSSEDKGNAHFELVSPMHRAALNFNTSFETNAQLAERRLSAGRCTASTPDSGIHQTPTQSLSQKFCPPTSPHKSPKIYNFNSVASTSKPPTKSFSDKSCNSSPKRFVSTLSSPLDPTANGGNSTSMSLTREHALKHEIEQLQEKLKDTEERLESIRIQNENLSQMQRTLRESNSRLQEESDVLKLDVKHLNDCANVLRTELLAARTDRSEALDLHKVLQQELEESRQERKRALEQKDKDARTIQDLQRQCREMERILMRKHPDSVSALIVASKNNGSKEQDNNNSRKLLEQRIAQLEADAKEQDAKAQQILANVQARFNSVQAKYETHIADLETQVLSLQEINAKLNEKIEYQVRTLDYFVKKRHEKFYNNSTQTDDVSYTEADCNTDPVQFGTAEQQQPAHPTSTVFTQTKVPGKRDHSTNTIGMPTAYLPHLQHSASSSTSSTTNSTPNNSRPNSKQSGLRKPPTISSSMSSLQSSKLPISHSDSTITLSASTAAATAKEDAHLLATIRGMRVDLAIKSKALQRITKELDDCKKTIRKMQREKELYKAEKFSTAASSATSTRRNSNQDLSQDQHTPATTENHALREALNKYKLLETDYKSLHDKRMQDLKTLQSAHERELNSCHETVRILQQRLNERDEQNSTSVQKRRKLPVDYYALKAKVTSLERRHTEREERLHLLVEALSKGRINGCLEDLLRDNNNECNN